MHETRLAETCNFREVDPHLLTAGQPNEDQLADAAAHGVQVVINLGLHDDPRYSLEDEPAWVTNHGMTYVHIPVEFGNPTRSDLLAFFDAMDAHQGRKILVHCAANKRVTAFVGLYNALRRSVALETAFAPMRSVWVPDGVWQRFIDDAVREGGAGAMQVRLVEQLSPEEGDRLFRWGENIFDTAHLNLTYRAKEATDRRFVLYDELNAPVSHVAVLTHRARANGTDVLIGGIGGVVTIPGARRRGHAARLLGDATAFLRDEWKVDFALLFCIDRMVEYYARLGWRTVQCGVLIDQPSGRRRCPFHVMTIPFRPEFETIDALDLGSASW